MKKYTDEELRSALNILNSILDKENSNLDELNREEAQEALNLIKQNSTNERKSKNKRKKMTLVHVAVHIYLIYLIIWTRGVVHEHDVVLLQVTCLSTVLLIEFKGCVLLQF